MFKVFKFNTSRLDTEWKEYLIRIIDDCNGHVRTQSANEVIALIPNNEVSRMREYCNRDGFNYSIS